MKRRGFAAVLIILIVVIVLAIAGGIWYYEAHQSGISSSETTVGTVTDYTGWNTYTNASSGFSFKYPANFNFSPEIYGNPPDGIEVLISGNPPPGTPSSNTEADPILVLLTSDQGSSSVESNINYILANPSQSGCSATVQISTTTVEGSEAAITSCTLPAQYDTPPQYILDFYNSGIHYNLVLTAVPSAKNIIEEIADSFVFTQGSESLPAQVTPPQSVTVSDTGPSSVNFEINSTTNPLVIAQGDNANFSWTSKNVTNCMQVGNWFNSPTTSTLSLDATGTQLWSSDPGDPTSTVNMGVSCTGANGARIQSNLIPVTATPLTLSVIQDPDVTNPLSVPSSGKKQLLASYKVVASGIEGIALDAITFNISQDVTPSELSLQNPEIYLSVPGTSDSTWWVQPPYATTDFVPGYQGDGDNLMEGSFTIPRNDTAYIQIYGDTVSAKPGTYTSPIILNSIEGGGTGKLIYPNVLNAQWLMFGVANLPGQNVTVTSQ